MEQYSDQQLLTKARAGDRQAVGELLLRHGAPLGKQLDINRKWRSVLEPNDVLQVTYFEAYERIRFFDGTAQTFPHWLRRIAENNLKDAIRCLERDKRPQPDNRVAAPTEDGDKGAAWLMNMVASGAASPSRHARQNEVREILEAEIDRLPDDYRLVLRQIYLEDKTVAEVAERMGRTKGAVHLLRIRAVERLRKQLGSATGLLSFH